MILKKKFKDLHLRSSAADCTQCGSRHVITNPVDREGMRGVLCRNCRNILWMASIRDIYVPSTDQSLTLEARKARRERQEKDFFSTLPACPYCTRHEWDTFLEWVNYPPDCWRCGKTFEIGVFKDITESRSDETAYWFEEDRS